MVLFICAFSYWGILSNYFWKQANHRITTKMQRSLYSHATDAEIRPLNEEKAVQAAVDLIGEFFVFTVTYSCSSSFVEFLYLIDLAVNSCVSLKRNELVVSLPADESQEQRCFLDD